MNLLTTLPDDCAVALGMNLNALDVEFRNFMLKKFPGNYLSYWINKCLCLIYFTFYADLLHQ
jgi:hypothetical protein